MNSEGFFGKLFVKPRPEEGAVNPDVRTGTDETSPDPDHPMGNQRIKFDLFIHDLKVPLAVIEAGVLSILEREER